MQKPHFYRRNHRVSIFRELNKYTLHPESYRAQEEEDMKEDTRRTSGQFLGQIKERKSPETQLICPKTQPAFTAHEISRKTAKMFSPSCSYNKI